MQPRAVIRRMCLTLRQIPFDLEAVMSVEEMTLEAADPAKSAPLRRILIVEDETIIRSALRRLLERNQYEVSEAGSVQEAQERFSIPGFDLIVSALRLPGAPGTELIKLAEGTPEFDAKMEELMAWKVDYEKFRLYPEMPDWDVMCFYPMLKKRLGEDNWYSLDFDTRKKLMRTHAITGRKYAGRISQLITGSTGLDDWEWGVTLMAKEVASIKDIVHEMRKDEVTARYGEFGPFYINLRLEPPALWAHLGL